MARKTASEIRGQGMSNIAKETARRAANKASTRAADMLDRAEDRRSLKNLGPGTKKHLDTPYKAYLDKKPLKKYKKS